MDSIYGSKEALLQAIRQSGAFKRFEESKKELEQYPDRWSRMDEFRRKVFHIQRSDDVWDRIDEMNHLFDERQDVRKDPLIADFLDAELELCRILQDICNDVMDIADIRVDEEFDT